MEGLKQLFHTHFKNTDGDSGSSEALEAALNAILAMGVDSPEKMLDVEKKQLRAAGMEDQVGAAAPAAAAPS